MLGPMLYGQEGLRNAMAGDAAIAVRAQPLPSYTVRAGDFKMLLVPSLEADWNDNVNVSQSGAQSDFIVKPLLEATANYQLTQQNVLSVIAGVGYDEYIKYRQYSALRVNADSGPSFDAHLKDFWINIHDRFQYSQDSATDPRIAETARYGGLNNAAGLFVTWQPRKVVLTLGYDHQDFVSSADTFAYMNHTSELPWVRAGYQIWPDLTAGVEGTASFTDYSQQVLNNNQSYSAGVYADWKPARYLHIQPRIGLVTYQFGHTSQSAEISDFSPTGAPIVIPTAQTIETSDLNSWYGDLTMSDQLTKTVAWTLKAGHQIELGIQSDAVEDTYVDVGAQWAVIKAISLQTSMNYDHGKEGAGNVRGNLTDTYDWINAGFSVSYSVMKRLMLSLSYRLTLRTAGTTAGRYTQDLIGLQVTYHL
jgi:hypothetical protein